MDFTWLGLILTSLAILGGLEVTNFVLKKRTHTQIPSLIWPLALGVVVLDAGGDFFHFYSRWSWYDQVAHLLGGAVAAAVIYIIFIAVAQVHHWSHPQHLSLTYALGLATTLGVLYEIEEYLEDYFNLTNRLGSAQDTVNDLLMNLIGAFLIISLIKIFRRFHPQPS